MLQGRFSDLALVQRHAHERTQSVGLDLAASEFPGAIVTAVAAGDFPATLRACFERAVELDRPWTLTIDGDVLLLPHAGEAVHSLRDRMPNRFGHLGLLGHDRVTGEVRSAGVRLYRTRTMQAALQHGDWSGVLRPETHLLQSIDDGRGWTPSVIVGLHDHEQYLRDLFRTALVMVRKKAHQRERLIALWRTRADGPDDLALLAGAEAAERDDIPFAIDAARYRSLAEAFLKETGLEEKPPLDRVPDPATLERSLPPAAALLRHPGFAARHFPHVWRKAGNGVRGRSLARYALRRTLETLTGR